MIRAAYFFSICHMRRIKKKKKKRGGMADDQSAKARLFTQIRSELQRACTETTRVLLQQFAKGLCQFVPGRRDLCDEIARDFDLGDKGIDAAPVVAASLLSWMSKFQAPIHDAKTDVMAANLAEAARRRSQQSDDSLARGERDVYADAFVDFLEAFYDHSETCYKELLEFKAIIAALPPDDNNNGVPTSIRTGHK